MRNIAENCVTLQMPYRRVGTSGKGLDTINLKDITSKMKGKGLAVRRMELYS